MSVRRTNSAVSSSSQKCIDNFPLSLLRKAPRSKALDPRNTGCPLSLKLITMSSATRSHSPFGQVDQSPCANLLAYSATVWEFAIHNYSFPFFPHTMSLYINMKKIRLGKCSISIIMFWFSARLCIVVNPGYFFHSTSIDSKSIRSNSRHWDEFINRSIFSFHACVGFSLILPVHKTESKNT